MNNIQKLIRFPNRIPVQDITALREILGKADYDYAILLGKDKAADGYAREYYWSSTSTSIDNGDTIIKPTILGGFDQGRWLIVPRQSLIPRTFVSEFVGDGSQVLWKFNHQYGTRDLIVQIVEMGITGNTYNWVVETAIRLYDEYIEVEFNKHIPVSGERYKILATEIITT